MGASKTILGHSWAVLGLSWGPLRPPWGGLGGLFGCLGASRSRKGEKANIFFLKKKKRWKIDDFGFLGLSWEASWGSLGTSWSPFGKPPGDHGRDRPWPPPPPPGHVAAVVPWRPRASCRALSLLWCSQACCGARRHAVAFVRESGARVRVVLSRTQCCSVAQRHWCGARSAALVAASAVVYTGIVCAHGRFVVRERCGVHSRCGVRRHCGPKCRGRAQGQKNQ